MRRDLSLFKKHQVFLNYPFDVEFESMSYAMHYAVIAAGLLPVCARDLSLPDRPRVDVLVKAIANCQYSAYDLSRGRGAGDNNFARLNMSLEMGMALFHDLYTNGNAHVCSFFVATPHEYKEYVSDLAGFDAQCYEDDDITLLAQVYEWLRFVVPGKISIQPPTADVINEFQAFKIESQRINGSGKKGQPTHAEAQELMYKLCGEQGWWEWRENPLGLDEFPPLPLSRKNVQGPTEI